MTASKITAEQQELLERARAVRTKAYAPYSSHWVGAALRMADGRIFDGCNVENASYGATICAERTAILKAVSEGARLIREVAVVTDFSPPWPPCGLCLQVIAEFAAPDLKIILGSVKPGGETVAPMSDYFPKAFTSKHLT